jgi:hypothetical protein
MAALAIVVLIPIQMLVFFLWPPPNTVIGWFSLFQQDPFIVLIDMDLLLIVDYVLMLIIILSLWSILRRINESLMAIALLLQILSVAIYFSSTVAFEMLSLSNQYSSATSDQERFASLAAALYH